MNRVYTENQSIPTDLEFPTIASFGRVNTTPFQRRETLDDLIKKSSGNRSSYDPNFDGIVGSENSKNEFLDIPSFLYYPRDLGTNRRYHHFMVFNIYQGSSDSVRVAERQINQYTSALLASGGAQYGSQLKGEANGNVAVSLAQAGFTPEQIQQFAKAFAGTTSAQLILNGITANERINAADLILQGWANNVVSGNINGSGVISGSAGAIYDLGAESLSQLGEYFVKFVEAESRNYLKEENQVKRNEDQVGVSGRRVNKKKSEQNILLANRRFNFANVKSKDTICLYMPLKISFNDSLIYSEEEMGMAKAAMGTIMGKRGSASALVEKAGTSTVSGLVDQATNTVNLESVNLQGVRNSTTRTVSNPRREMLFKDVSIRTHNFSFEFAPRSPEEADSVLNIIRMLRYHAYPGLLGGGGHFFTFPAEFEATFYTIDESGAVVANDNLPKLPRLALTSVAVDYSGAGDFKTFIDAKPAFIRLDLGFQEMEQLTNEHIIHGY